MRQANQRLSRADRKQTADAAELLSQKPKRGQNEQQHAIGGSSAKENNCGCTADKLLQSSIGPAPAAESLGIGLEFSRAAPPAVVRFTESEKAREISPAAPLSLARGLPPNEQAVINKALAILAGYARAPGAVLDEPGLVREYLRLQLAGCARERFAVLFLDASNSVIAFEVIFEGTLAQTSVYPREVVKRALQLNASAVILAHNHPLC